MSYAYTDYHHLQSDRPFLSPLPMPSPNSCWYPQRQDVQFGYSYPRPEPVPPWLHQTTEYQQLTSYEPELYSHHQPLTAAYGQPPYASFDSGVNNTGWPPPPTAPAQMPEPYHHRPSQTPEPDIPYSHYQPSEELYPPVYNGEGYSSNSFNYIVDDYLPYTNSWQPGPSCGDPPTAAFEQPPNTYTESYAMLRIPYAGDHREQHDYQPPRLPHTDSESHEQIKGEGELLEYEEEDGFRKVSSLSPIHEALECIQIESAFCEKINNGVVKAIAICCPRVRKLGISSGMQVDAVRVIKDLAKHSLVCNYYHRGKMMLYIFTNILQGIGNLFGETPQNVRNIFLHLSSSKMRGTHVHLATLAEQAVRYDKMVESMINVAVLDVELSVNERNLLFVGYKNVVGARRASWRIRSSTEQKEECKGHDINVKLIKEYHLKVENELSKFFHDILAVIDKHLIPSKSTVFFHKKKVDNCRYLAEFKVDQEKEWAANLSLKGSEAVSAIAEEDDWRHSTIPFCVKQRFGAFDPGGDTSLCCFIRQSFCYRQPSVVASWFPPLNESTS